jgi:hypothetical protein
MNRLPCFAYQPLRLAVATGRPAALLMLSMRSRWATTPDFTSQSIHS